MSKETINRIKIILCMILPPVEVLMCRPDCHQLGHLPREKLALGVNQVYPDKTYIMEVGKTVRY